VAALTGLTIIKSFPYKGVQEEWSNHYHLTGTPPTDATAWQALFDAMVAAEKTCYSAACNVVAGYGYATDVATDHAVWSVDMTVSPHSIVPGTLATSTAQRAPGDCAGWVRWKLDRNNSLGKAVFLRKYFHDVFVASGGESVADTILAAQVTAYTAFAALLDTGIGVDSGIKIKDKAGAAILSHGASTYVTTRTLKRRGKRPPTP